MYYYFLSVCVVVLSETVGIWFLNTQMNIPQDRILAANWVMQCAIASFVLGLLMLPYNAALIAHENMNIFAYISILEAVLKLAIVFALYISPYDKLITYAILLLRYLVSFAGFMRLIADGITKNVGFIMFMTRDL